MVLVFGGSFNPPTKAHYEIIKQLQKSFKVEKVILVPVGDSYHWKEGLLPFKDRFLMLKLLISDLDGVELSDIENSDNFLGTYHTLKSLQKNDEQLYFVVGTDHLAMIKEWKNYEALLKEFGFIVILRKNYQADFNILDVHQTPYYTFYFESDISSSRIRNEITKYKNDLLPQIYDYIVRNKLYQGENK